ncbi:MAG: endopeptidase La, partial [Candidatus Aminicenantes bacterium]
MAKTNGEYDSLIEETGEQSDQKIDVPSELPVLMLRDIVVFPYMVVPLFVGREKSMKAIDEALSRNRMILLVSQKKMEVEEPKREDIYPLGTVALIMRMLKLPDGRVRVLAQGLIRARIDELIED